MNQSPVTADRWVKTWLLVGVVMVFFQIVIGGVTRLTGSGLSITRWEIVTGTLPPLSAADWEEAFDQYKATPQYQKINAGMEMSEFRFIYFWEYIHRLWARMMGFVFAIPFVYFLVRGALSKRLIRRLGVVILLAALAAVFGWIMVASGLQDRPWVNAYKLTVHLSLGVSLFLFLFYTWLEERGYRRLVVSRAWRRTIGWLIVLTIVQLAVGGTVSGMKAALAYPTWPDMHGSWIPPVLLDGSQWTVDNFLLYDQSGFMPALAQFVHRHLAYLLVVAVTVIALRWLKFAEPGDRGLGYMMLGTILVQVFLGILTLVGSVGSIPVFYGSVHQGVGILFLALLVYIFIRMRYKQIT